MDYVSVHAPGDDAIETEAEKATWDILERTLSNEVVTPGKTTLMDVHYWITSERKRQNFESTFSQASTSSASVMAKSSRWTMRMIQ